MLRIDDVTLPKKEVGEFKYKKIQFDIYYPSKKS